MHPSGKRSYCGWEPGHGVGVVELEHMRIGGQQLGKQVVEKVFLVDKWPFGVSIQKDLRGTMFQMLCRRQGGTGVCDCAATNSSSFTINGFLKSWGSAAASCAKASSTRKERRRWSSKLKDVGDGWGTVPRTSWMTRCCKEKPNCHLQVSY